MTMQSNHAPLEFVDVHYHANPDQFKRRYSASEAASLYAKENGWVVLKNHLGCTAAQAYEARAQGLPVSGSIVLNEIAGGLNFRAVEQSLCFDQDSPFRFIVHLPTVTGRKHNSRLARSLSSPILTNSPIKPLQVSDHSGRLKPEVLDILRMAKDYPLVISTGHADGAEVRLLVEEAVRLDVPRLMLNQPANPLTGLLAKDLSELLEAPNVYAEQTALTYLLEYQTQADFQEVLLRSPRVVYSSDLGQTSQPDITDWLTMSRDWFGALGISAERERDIRLTHPVEMLSL
nr:DUF6282 family protein [Pseudomonas viridiflava]